MTNHLHPEHSCAVCKPLRPANSTLWDGPVLGRRNFFKIASTGVAGFFLSPLVKPATVTASVTPRLKGTARNVIFILLGGAPSHVDTFDLKVGSWTPANFNPTTYNNGALLFPQGLMPGIAEHLNKLAILRSVRAPALVHQLQQVWTQIARSPSSALGKIAPNIGSVVALEMEARRTPEQKLPGFISLNTGGNLVGAGYFNARYSPFDVSASPNGLTNLSNADGRTLFETRYAMLQEVDGELRQNSPLGNAVFDMESFYAQSKGMMYDAQVDSIFRFSTADQQRYGNSGFGNSCITARNLVKANLGTRYIQINLGGWDNHTNIYANPGGIYGPAGQFDKGFSNLLTDLAALPGIQGGSLLDETLIVAMGEFGRTVGALTVNAGRDHFFQHFCVMAGGGVEGGKVIGSTTATGSNTLEFGWSQRRDIVNEDIAATIYSALGIDYTTTRNDDPLGRGFEYIPFASEGAWYPVMEVFDNNRFNSRGGRPGTKRRDGSGRGSNP